MAGVGAAGCFWEQALIGLEETLVGDGLSWRSLHETLHYSYLTRSNCNFNKCLQDGRDSFKFTKLRGHFRP